MTESKTDSFLPIFDVCGLHFNLEGWESYLLRFAESAPNYLYKFAYRFCQIAGADVEQFSSLLQTSPTEAVDYLIAQGDGFDESFEQYEARMRSEGVAHQILHGWSRRTRSGADCNTYIAECASRSPDLFSAWAHVDAGRHEKPGQLIEDYVKTLGIQGLTLIPFLDEMPVSHPAYNPILDKANELKLPVWIHGGQNFHKQVSLHTSHVKHVDDVASRYPDLTLLIGHGGWPWIGETIAICQRHANVYLEFSSHRPAHMASPGSIWGALLDQASISMRKHVLFGASGWVATKPISVLAEETMALPIKKEIAESWIFSNARRALKPDMPSISKNRPSNDLVKTAPKGADAYLD